MLEKFLEMTGKPSPIGIVHVGAHIGQEILEYKEYAPLNIVWIEADPYIYQRLHESVTQQWGLTNTEQWCINALVSDTDDELKNFHIAKNNSQSSSMFEFSEFHISRYPHAGPTGEVLQLTSKTLCTLLEGVGLEPAQLDYLVIDTQGAELKCLAGLAGYIEHIQYMTLEVSTIEHYLGGAIMYELDEYLESRSFLRVSGTPKRKHGDALYIRIPQKAPPVDREMSFEDQQDDEAIRGYVNSVVSRLKSKEDWKSIDFIELDEELLAAYDKFEVILARRSSRDICLAITRLAYDNGLSKSLKCCLQPLLQL